MKTAREVLEYRRRANNGSLGVYYDSDLLGSTITMTGLLRKALREDSWVGIFTDDLFLFGKESEIRINLIKDSIESDGSEEWKNFDPSRELKDCFIDYIKRKPRALKIIVKNPQKIPSSILEILKEYSIGMYILRSDLGLDGFAFTEEDCRIENSDGSISGSFTDPSNAQMLEDIFIQELLIKRSEKFNYD